MTSHSQSGCLALSTIAQFCYSQNTGIEGEILGPVLSVTYDVTLDQPVKQKLVFV